MAGPARATELNAPLSHFARVPRRPWVVYYSYDTCAGENHTIDEDQFAFYLMEHFGVGRLFRAVIPWSSIPLHFKRDPSGDPYVCDPTGCATEVYENDKLPWNGIYMEFFRTLLGVEARANGFASMDARNGGIKFTFVSGGSRRTTDSAWTAAVKDVARGVADFAISDFWMTVERLNLVGFTTPVRVDSLHLWVTRPMREANASFLELAAKIFKPFTQELWGTIAAIVLIMSLVSLWLRRDEVSQTVQEFRPDPEEAGRCKRCFSLIATVGLEWMHQAGQSLMRITVGLPGVQAKTAAETTLWLGWSIFLLLVLTAYTANLAAFLIEAPRPSSYITSLEYADVSNMKICLYDSLIGELRTAFPEIKTSTLFAIPSHILGTDGALERYYVANGCEGMIHSINEVRRDFDMASMMCALNLFAVRHIMDIPMAFPVTKEPAGPMSYWVEQLTSTYLFTLHFDAPFYLRCSDTRHGPLSWPDRQPTNASTGGAAGAEGTGRRRQLAGKTGGAAGAGAASVRNSWCCADENKLWTDVGLIQTESLPALTVGNLSAAILAWAACLVLAIPLSIYHQKTRVYDPPPRTHEQYTRRRSKMRERHQSKMRELRERAKQGAAAVHGATSAAMNAVERGAGLDLDRDGDVDVAGSTNRT